MRIVQIVETLNIGGLERMAVELALEQKAAGHFPILYAIFSTGPFADVAEANGIPVRCFNKVPGPSLPALTRIVRALKHDTPDVVHSHAAGIHHYAAVAGRVAGVHAIVSTLHSPSATLLRPYQHRYFRWTLPLTSNVATVSRATLEFLVSHGLPRQKLRVIHNGVPVAKYRAAPAKRAADQPFIRFGTVGRFVPEKDHATLLAAFKEVLVQTPNVKLKIVGYGPLEDHVRGLVENLGLGSKVTLQGRTNDTASVLSELDVFVLSSNSEGLPMVILEAMAAGLPIVSTRVGGVEEVAPEGAVAWYCNPGSPKELASAMIEAIRSPRLQEMGNLARMEATVNFDISVTQKQYEKMYLDSMSENRV